jgi:hypothetical protein
VDRGGGEEGSGGSSIRSRSDLRPSPFPIPGCLSSSNDNLRRFRGDGLPLSDPVLPGYRRPELPAIRSPYLDLLGESCWPMPEPVAIGGVQLVYGYTAAARRLGQNEIDFIRLTVLEARSQIDGNFGHVRGVLFFAFHLALDLDHSARTRSSSLLYPCSHLYLILLI